MQFQVDLATGASQAVQHSHSAGHSACHTPRSSQVCGVGSGVVLQGPAGLRGAPGPEGGKTFSGTAVVALSGQTAVYAAPDGLRPASATGASTAQAAGVTTGAASAGAAATVQAEGELVEPTWSWQAGQPVWLGINGQLTQTPPATGVQVEIGLATAPTKLLIRIQPAIHLI